MPQVPDAVQNVLDAVDAQINKERSPLVNVLLGTPIYIIVSLPIAFIVGVVVIIFTGTLDTVAQGSTTPGIIAGLLTVFLFWAWAAYGTYTSSQGLGNGAPSGGE